MPLHFLDEGLGDARPGDRLELSGAEAHHAAAVRRVREGEEVTLGDGRGLWVTARVAGVEPRLVALDVVDAERRAEPARPLVLVQALAKGDRDELAVQAATEIGVDRIVPWQAQRSISRWSGPKVVKGVERWRSIVREAAKQAHRAWLPAVEEPRDTPGLAAALEGLDVVVLDPRGEATLGGAIDAEGTRGLALVVGPEGGIAPDEIATLEAAGARVARLGESVLRTSTAGPAALAVASVALGRW